MKFILVAILAGLLAGCASTSEYYKGCVDGVEGMRLQLRNDVMAEPDIVGYYCKVVERNREKREQTPHKP